MTRRRGSIAAAGLLVVAGSMPPTSAGRSQTTPSADVPIRVVVEDAQGKVVRGLGPNDFLVLVDGLPATVATAAMDSTPLSAVLLVDVTASLHGCPGGVAGIPSTARTSTGSQFPEPIPPAVEPFALNGVRADDRVRVGVIGRQLALDGTFLAGVNDIRRRWRALFDLPPVDWLGPSPIWDAVATATTAVADQPGHRAVVLVSDGAATGNVRGRREVAAAAARAGVPVSVVAEEAVIRLPASASLGDAVDPSDGLLALADDTGGVAVLDKAVSDDTLLRPCYTHQSARALQFVLDRLHDTYLLHLALSTDGREATLDVRVKRPGLRVTAAPKTCPVPRRGPA